VSSAAEDDALAAELIEELANKLRAGEPLDLEAVMREHPAQTERLRKLLPAIQVLAELGESAASGSAPVQVSGADAAGGTLGDFRIIRQIGQGGMGVVYEAEQISLRRRVALKVLPFAATMDPRHLQRFKNEAQAAAGLHHTNIVPVYFVGSERGVHFYAMQFIEGQTLAAFIRQLRGQAAEKAPAGAAREQPTTPYEMLPEKGTGTLALPTPPAADTEPAARAVTLATVDSPRGREYFRRVAELGVQAAEALDHAHQMGVVHRDIKPGNLMLDTAGRIWVTDFGLAHMQHGEGSLTLTGDLVGTLRYMSPEQALAKRVVIDHRTDIYSLGMTLYELLTLEPPFAGKDREELLRQIAFEEPKPPRRLDKAIPVELETILLKTMEKNPADRYATAAELAQDLRHFLEDRPIRARRPSVLQRINKLARRHRGVVWASFVGLAAAVVILAISTVVIWRTAQAEREAKTLAERRYEQIEKGIHLLGSIFHDVSPVNEKKEGKTLRLLLGERLDQAAKELEEETVW
jgi:serine/threonine protein kinase